MDRADVQVKERFAEDVRPVREPACRQVLLVALEQGLQFRVLARIRERLTRKRRRGHAGHAQLGDGGPEGLGHLRLFRQAAEVRGHGPRQLEEHARDQRRADVVGRGIDAALYQEGRRHGQRQVERRGEAYVRPAAGTERQPLAQGVAERVRGHDHPLGAGALGAANLGEPGEEGLHAELSWDLL